jgi:hypothetical protein
MQRLVLTIAVIVAIVFGINAWGNFKDKQTVRAIQASNANVAKIDRCEAQVKAEYGPAVQTELKYPFMSSVDYVTNELNALKACEAE